MTTYENMAAIAAERTRDAETDAHTQSLTRAEELAQIAQERRDAILATLEEVATNLKIISDEVKQTTGFVSAGLNPVTDDPAIHLLPFLFNDLFDSCDIAFRDIPEQSNVEVSTTFHGIKVYCLEDAKFARVVE